MCENKVLYVVPYLQIIFTIKKKNPKKTRINTKTRITWVGFSSRKMLIPSATPSSAAE